MESKTVEKIRPITITAASLAFIIFGAVTIVYAVLFGIALSSLHGISGIGVIIIIVGILFLITLIGILDIVAGYGLWHMKRWASIMGMLLGIFGLIVQNFPYLIIGATYPTYPYSALSFASVASPWIDVILVVLIAISWKSFEPSTT